ncbi:MAG: hypothetical protein ACFB5Z_10575 [Elainellaceae cyanobacterium]
MKHALVHRFQAALASAYWGYSQPWGDRPASLEPLSHWSQLSVPLEISDLLQRRAAQAPLSFIFALLPLLLHYSDDDPGLRRWLGPLNTCVNSPRSNVVDVNTGTNAGDAATALATEGACLLRQLTEAAIAERPVCLSPGAQYPYLSPYLSVVLAYQGSGAGLVQVQGALEQVAEKPVGEQRSKDIAARSAVALALALHSAFRTPNCVELACGSIAPLIPSQAAEAAAIAGYLCGLGEGLAGSLQRYQMLDAVLPAAPNSLGAGPRAVPLTVRALGQDIMAAWSGAIHPQTHHSQIKTAAIAMPDTIRGRRT